MAYTTKGPSPAEYWHHDRLDIRRSQRAYLAEALEADNHEQVMYWLERMVRTADELTWYEEHGA